MPGVADEQVGVALPLRPLRVETSILEILEVEPTEEVDEVDPCNAKNDTVSNGTRTRTYLSTYSLMLQGVQTSLEYIPHKLGQSIHHPCIVNYRKRKAKKEVFMGHLTKFF